MPNWFEVNEKYYNFPGFLHDKIAQIGVLSRARLY